MYSTCWGGTPADRAPSMNGPVRLLELESPLRISTIFSSCSRLATGVAFCAALVLFPGAVLAQGVTVLPTSLIVPEVGSQDYTVTLETQPAADVTITVERASGGDEDLTASPATLTFTNANWDPQMVTISAAEDADGEDGTAQFFHTAASTDGNYDKIGIDPVTVTEKDNDTVGVTVSTETLTVPEDGSAIYTVVLNIQPIADVTITVERTVGGDEDLTASPATLTFTNANWYIEQTVTIMAAEDDDGVFGVAVFGHDVDSPGTAYDGIPTPGVKVTEGETDTVGVTVSPTTLTVPEGGSAEYTVVLLTQPQNTVTIEPTPDQGSDADLTVSPATLTFTDEDWYMAQKVTVSADQDADQVNGVAIFSHTAKSDDEDYDDIGIDPVRATENDNDKDVIRPKVALQTEALAPVGGAFEVTIRFSESVRGFTLMDIGVNNGAASNFNKVSSQTYTVTVTPEATGEVRVEVAARVARDGAGNGNRAAVPLVIEADLTGPEVTIASAATGAVSGAFALTISFSEAVTGFEQDEIRVMNGSVTGFSGSGTSYTAEITPSASGQVKVEVGADVAEDGAGNGNEAAAFVIEADLTGPEVTIASAATGAVSGAFALTISFSEAVTGFEQDEIRVTNGSVTGFSGSGTSYTAEITPSASGQVKVEVGADVAEDGAGNGNEAAAFVIEADLERPEVMIAGPAEPVPVGMAGFEVRITFSEPVAGFEREDIQVSNGMVVGFTPVSPSAYDATIEPAAAGSPVMVEVPEDVAEDGAGNGNAAAAPFIVETAIEVSYAAASYTATEGGETVTLTVQLNQAGDKALAIPIQVRRPATTEVGDYTVAGLEDWDAEGGAGTLTFAAGETEQTLRITANHDGDGDDETLELGFGTLPEIVITGEPAVVMVTLEDKGLVVLQVSFGQAAYEVNEGQVADIEMKMSPAADRRVDVPLVVTLRGGTTPEDLSGVPASLVFEEGESEGTISVEVLADEVNDPGEGIVLSLGGLPEAVNAGDPASTQVHFGQRRTAAQFSQTQEGLLAVVARATAVSAQTAIEGRFERHRQWSRLGAPVGGPPPGSDASTTAPSPWGAAQAGAATESAWNSGNQATGTPGAWLRSVLPGSSGNVARSDRPHLGASPETGAAPGGRVYGEAQRYGSGVDDTPPEPVSGGISEMMGHYVSLSAVSFETPLGEGEQETSWVPVLWGQGDLQRFNGDVTRLGLDYSGDLDAAHVGLDLYANEQMLAGLSFMHSWGDLDYSVDGTDGVLASRMNTVHPYLYWQPTERLSVWGIGGWGSGEVDVEEPGRMHDFDADFRMFAGGVRALLSRRGNNEWGLRADGFTTRLATDASEDIAKVSGAAHRARLMLEWVHDKALSAERSVSFKAEAGGRFDGGDADRGAGLETGFRVGYLDAHHGLDVALHGRVLVVHASDYRDWGVGIQASWDPGQKQRGLRASVTSSLGRDGAGRTTLWDNADAVMRPAGMEAMGIGSQYRMESEVAYAGMKVRGLAGLLTPYSRLRLTGQGRELAWGAAWSLPTRPQLGLPATFELEGLRRDSITGRPEHGLLLRISLPF